MNSINDWARWHVPVISATVGNVKQEDQGPDQPGQKDPMSKITRVKREGGVRSPEFKPQYHQKKKVDPSLNYASPKPMK
jgi:hypothetical protein